MLELLSPAGSMEALRAAVQNGADAVYMGYGDFNARRNAKNFTEEEFAAAVSYCHLRGCKLYLTLNTLVTDRELPGAIDCAVRASALGVDAVLVQDLGILRLLRQAAPDLPVHASTQMTVHNLDGVKRMADFGMTRAVLSRELDRKAIAYICERSPIEIEVFGHGALCMCYSGQCFMSSVIGGRSGNRGLCAQPCRLRYGWNGKADGNPLSLKDMSLAGHLRELRKMGVSCLKLEGRMKRPEYVAVVTRVYAAAIREGREPTPEEVQALTKAFSRQGFTDGFYQGQTGPAMFGVREEEKEPKELFAQARQTYEDGEAQRVPVEFYAVVRRGETVKVAARDEETARRAAALVKVEYEELPYALNFEDALAGKHCLEGESPIVDEGTITVGEPQPDEAEGIVVTSHSELSRLHHAAMETHACVAQYDPSTGMLTVESPNQAVFGIRTVLADMLGLPYNRVRVIKATMGGSFGGKQEWIVEPVAAVLAKELNRPVKLVYDRMETMRSSYCRGAMRGDLRGVFRKDGTILRLDMDILYDAGAYISSGRD